MYVNRNLTPVARERSYGQLYGFRLGQSGRGRWEYFLPAPRELLSLEKGEHQELTLTRDKLGQWRISDWYRRVEKYTYLILSTKRSYEKMGNGGVFVPARQRSIVVARALGASGAAGRVGHWPEYVVRGFPGNVFIVRWSGYKYGIQSTLYYVDAGRQVHTCEIPEVRLLFASLGVEPPFRITQKDGVDLVENSEWKLL